WMSHLTTLSLQIGAIKPESSFQRLCDLINSMPCLKQLAINPMFAAKYQITNLAPTLARLERFSCDVDSFQDKLHPIRHLGPNCTHLRLGIFMQVETTFDTALMTEWLRVNPRLWSQLTHLYLN